MPKIPQNLRIPSDVSTVIEDHVGTNVRSHSRCLHPGCARKDSAIDAGFFFCILHLDPNPNLSHKVQQKRRASKIRFPNHPVCDYCEHASSSSRLFDSHSMIGMRVCNACNASEQMGCDLNNDTRRSWKNAMRHSLRGMSVFYSNQVLAENPDLTLHMY